MKMDYRLVIERLGILARLESFQPMVIGTPPLGTALEESDLDIACWTADLDDFERVIRVAYYSFDDFQIRRTAQSGTNRFASDVYRFWLADRGVLSDSTDRTPMGSEALSG